LYGLWIVARTRGLWQTLLSPPIVTIAYFTLVHSVTVSQDRYHISFGSLLAIYIAAGGVHLLRKFHARTS
jgi:hypothetical protein